MPVDFLTSEHKAGYGQFSGEPNEVQLARYFHLDEADLAFISNRRGEQNRLGCALQLTSVRFLGTFLSDLLLVPANVQAFVARQLSINDVSALANYSQREPTKREHAAIIREKYGYHEFNNRPWPFRLSRLIYSRAWISNERPSLMFDFAISWLIQHKVLLPGATTLSRLISEIRERAANRLWFRLSSLPSDKQKTELETLLHVPDGERTSNFDRYRRGPVTISGPAFNEAVERYKDLLAFGMQELDFSHIPPVRLKILARHAGMISMHKIARMPDEKRIAILVAFVKAYETIALDEALDVIDLLITSIAGEAKKIFQKKRLRTLKDLDKSALTLAEVCALILNDDAHGDRLREAIFTLISKEKLVESIATVNNLARPSDDKFHEEMVEQYGRVRRFLPNLLSSIVFKAAPAGKITLGAFQYLAALSVSKQKLLEEPPSLTRLSRKVNELLPKVDLTELLLEIHAHTGFADEFTHVSESNARADDLSISICAVLLAEACNIGLEPLAKRNVPALTRYRLNWVKQNYLRAETLVRANARLVDHQLTLPLANKWGGGEVASADGLRFVTPIRTINSGPNRKYFGSKRGITWYNFVSDQYSGFHGIVVPGTLRDSIFVLEGLLEQQTGLNPTEIMTDTAGTSDMVFGLFWLLGYQFSPRLADAGEAVFWRLDKSIDYGVLNDLARGYANPQRIEQHWDDMMRIAGSLKMGTVQASELIRSLLKSERPSSLAKAIIEVGRINKTLYLLNYIDDEDYRRRILTQLTRGEGRHSVARAICYGRYGEIRKRYREGQEDQLGALGLVTNALVLWNTIYMQAALDYLRQQLFEIRREDEARLSPLAYEHVNMLGHYSFTLAENVMKGKLRALNQLSEQI